MQHAVAQLNDAITTAYRRAATIGDARNPSTIDLATVVFNLAHRETHACVNASLLDKNSASMTACSIARDKRVHSLDFAAAHIDTAAMDVKGCGAVCDVAAVDEGDASMDFEAPATVGSVAACNVEVLEGYMAFCVDLEDAC